MPSQMSNPSKSTPHLRPISALRPDPQPRSSIGSLDAGLAAIINDISRSMFSTFRGASITSSYRLCRNSKNSANTNSRCVSSRGRIKSYLSMQRNTSRSENWSLRTSAPLCRTKAQGPAKWSGSPLVTSRTRARSDCNATAVYAQSAGNYLMGDLSPICVGRHMQAVCNVGDICNPDARSYVAPTTVD